MLMDDLSLCISIFFPRLYFITIMCHHLSETSLIFHSKQMPVNVDDCFQLIFEVTLGVSPT